MGAEGCEVPHFSHNQATSGAKIMMNSEFSDWNQLLGNGMPNNWFEVLRSANKFRVEPACSNTDQNTAAQMKNTKMTMRRARSAAVQLLSMNSEPKNSTVMTSKE